MRKYHGRNDQGFTLIEMLVVIAVIAILAATVGPMLINHVSDAKVAAARTQIEILGTALDAYRLDNDRYPTTAQGLSALWARPVTSPVPGNWRGPYLRKPPPPDPWNKQYEYVSPGLHSPQTYDLASHGRDGQAGGVGEDDDLTSWAEVAR